MPAITSRKAATAGLMPTPRAPLCFMATRGHPGRLATTITLLLAGAFLAGCSITIGGRETVDPAAIIDTIRRQLRDSIPDAGEVGSVACPIGVKLAKDVTFECTADVAGAQLPIAVTLTHVNTDTGAFDYNIKPTKALIDTDKLVKEIESGLPVQAANATVDCGTPRVRVVEVGGTIECTISQGSMHEVVHAVVEDVDGTVQFEPVAQPRPEVATGRLGDKLTVYDEFGDAQLEVTVTRVKFTSGDEFERPRRGLYMGVHVKAHALADDQYLVSIYARVRGHLYDPAITGSLAFDPPLEAAMLNKGERAAGWLVFDVPARHGQLVLRNLDEQTVAIWKY